jgi:integrase
MSDMEINSKTIGIEEFDFDEEITTQWGGKIIPRNDEWFLENHNINFRKLARLSTNSFVERFKIVLAYRSMRYAYRTITNDFNRCFEFLNYLESKSFSSIDIFSEEHIVCWLAGLTEAERKHQLGAMRGVLLSSKTFLNTPLIDDAATSYLAQLRLPGNPKGGRVNDPEQGRMTLAERDLFETRSRQAYEMGHIDSQEYLTLILFNAFGLRLTDYCSLKVKDVHVEFSAGYISKATIDIPTGKSGETPRSKMSRGNVVDHDVAILLHSLITKRHDVCPLFDIAASEARTQTGVLEGHHTVSTWSNYLQGAINKLHLGFHLNSYRFRYTVGTEAYRETGNPYVAAAVLRHSDIQNVKVYGNEIILAQAHDRVVAEVFKDIGAVIAAGVQANTFVGILITQQNYKEAKLIAVRAREQIGNFDPIGGCGGKAGCSQGAPVACYCCFKFRPVINADHFGMLCATLSDYFLILEDDEKRATSLVSAILGMAQVCYLTGQGLSPGAKVS